MYAARSLLTRALQIYATVAERPLREWTHSASGPALRLICLTNISWAVEAGAFMVIHAEKLAWVHNGLTFSELGCCGGGPFLCACS